jgi:hypothetical protein
MADATLRDLTAATDIAATDVLVIQNTRSDGAYYKITGTNFAGALESGGGIELSLAAAQVPAAGADTRVQYNNGGARGGDATQLKLPKVVFGDGDSGVSEQTDDIVLFFTPSSSPLLVSSGSLYSGESGSGALLDEAASSTNPTIVPNQGDTDTGVGLAAADKLSLIAGGLELARLSESTKDQVMFYCPPLGGKGDFTIKNYIRNNWFTNGFGFFVDEDNDKLEFWARYSNGTTVKNHELALA